MSKTIDEKVVSMQFDNAQFEKNVHTSMSTLNQLKQSLDLTGAAKGLEGINAAAKGFDMSPLANGVEMVRSKFSALEVMAITTLANITNSAVNAGKRLAAAFTIEPIKTGFQEYETQINAVQTILSNTRSKGTTLDQVNKALDELNHYADMTIYNFTEMTRNIGTFTAAGVDLDTSVSAIKGIANLAAVSGSNAQQASTAMYQLSQALASGTVKLMDWNSVVNAGMGGQVFQDALKETARVHGIAIDDMIEKEGSFRETLKDGWLSSEILTETLAKFTGDLTEEQLKSMGYTEEQTKSIMALGKDANDAATKVKTFTQLLDTLKEAAQSGWTQTWEYIVGDFEDAKKLWTSVSDTLSDMIGKSADARNKVVGEWAENGGRAAGIEAIKNAFEGLMNIIKPIKEAFRNVFPPATSEQLIKITQGIRDLTASFKEWTSKNADKIKSTFEGIFSVLKIGVVIVKTAASVIAILITKITGFSGSILSITGYLGEWIGRMVKAVTETNLFSKAISVINDILRKATDKIKEFVSYLKNRFEAPGFEALANIFNNLWIGIKKVGLAVVGVAASIGKALATALRNGDMKSLLDLVNGGIITTILLKLKSWVSGFKDLAGEGKNFIDTVKDIFGTVEDSLKSWQTNLKVDTIKAIAVSIGILSAALWVLSGIDPDKLASALGGITVLFAELFVVVKAFNGLTINGKGMLKTVQFMIGMSAAVLILASAVRILGSLDLEGLAKGLAGIGVLLAELIGATKLMSMGGKKIAKGATQMVIMAAALKIMASVCKDLSTLSWEGLAKDVAGIGGLLAVFAGFAELIKLINPAKMMSSAFSLLVIGTAMEIFVDVCAKLGNIEWGSFGKAGAAISGILLIAAGFGKLSGYTSKMIVGSTALIIIGAAMEIFADVCNKFGQMNWGDLGKAGAAIGGILALAAGFALLAGLSSKMFASVSCLTIMAVAMEIFADVCNKFGQMNWGDLAKAGTAIGGILALVAGFALLAGLSKQMFKSVACLTIMAVALRVFTPVLVTLGKMSVGEIAKGLLALAGAFTILGLAGLLLGPVVPQILALSGAIALFGVGCLAAGVGVAAFSAGVMALAGVTAAGAAAIVASLHIIIVGVLELIPAIIGALTDAVVALCQVFIQSIPAICKAVKVLILELTNVLVECVPTLVDSIFKTIVYVLDALTEYTPQLVDGLVNFIIALIDSLAERLPEFVSSVVNFIVMLVGSVGENMGPIVDALVKLFAGIIDAVSNVLWQIAVVIQSVGNVISQSLNGVANVFTAFGNAIRNSLEGIASIFDSIFDGIADVITAFGDSVRSILDGISGIIESMGNAALNAGMGFERLANGIKTITDLNLADMAASLTAVAVGVGKISSNGDDLKKCGDAMSELKKSTTISSQAFATMAESIGLVSSTLSIVGDIAASSMAALVSAVSDSSGAFDGFIDSNGAAQDSIKEFGSALDAAISGINSYYTDFYKCGEYLATGFANGIKSNSYKAKLVAIDMAKLADQAAREKLGIESPSKVFKEIGGYVVKGFARGIENFSYLGVRAVEGMSNDAIDSASKVLSNINAVLTDDVNTQPMIRPIVDLSNVESSSDAISNMLAMDPTVSAFSNVRSISAMMNRNQNGANDDVVSAIKDLGKTIGKASGDTYQINGITYDSGSEVSEAIQTLIRASIIEGRR